MHRDLVDLLTCPDCRGEVDVVLDVTEESADGEIVSGGLSCPHCGGSWPIIRGIPRFVARQDDYADNFSFEWRRWGRVQMDRHAGHTLSEDRFLKDSGWTPEWMRGKRILDAGCGAGRFSDIAAKHGARVVAVDLSGAVDACAENTRGHGSAVDIVQASFYALPFKSGVFDALYCMGVIQHTPDPERTMRILPRVLKQGGRLAYNWYEVSPMTKLQPIKYALRLITPHLPHAFNHGFALVLTTLLFPITWLLHFIPKVRILNAAMPICATHDPRLTIRQQFVWTLLDTFDWYSPKYEHRQRKERVAQLLAEEGLTAIKVADGLGWAEKG